MKTFKAGDKVKVWSLQSFSGGGFLNGKEATVRQGNEQGGDSILLRVERNIGGKYQIDPAYEVYANQCELIEKGSESITKEALISLFEELISKLKSI